MENLSLGQQSPVEQSPVLDPSLVEVRLEEEEDREEREQTEVGRDPSPVVEVEVVVVEVEEEDPRVLEVRSPDLARLPALGEMSSPAWEPVRRSAR